MLVDEWLCTYYDKYYEKKKQAQENLLKSVRGQVAIIYRNGTKGFIKQATFDQRPRGKKRASPEDATLRSRPCKCKDRKKEAECA